MKEELEFAFSESTKMLENGKRVILGNTKTGEWVKISKESYHILKRAIDEKYTMKEFIQIFQSDDDRCYMKELLEKFEDINLITHKKMEQKFAPKFITFAVTNKCNLKCTHCCVDADNESEMLKTEECKEIIKKIVSLNPEQIIFTGGEPLIRDDILDEFDRVVFESIIDKVYVGGYDEDGNADPYKLTFVLKGNQSSTIPNAKESIRSKKQLN